ncbi:hypothetical protein GF336_03350 [Candidatus Woesearchaeota archaeon]|nr:hypothetical protein [Candidatus Woesearchaeota archaeon]
MEEGEECDDNNNQDGDGCSAVCLLEEDCIYDDSCTSATSGNFVFSGISKVDNCDGTYTYSFKITNNYNRGLSYVAISLPPGTIPSWPSDGSVYSGEFNNYEVENPTNNPFYSIKYETLGEGVRDGGYDIFSFTLDQDISYPITLQAKAATYQESAQIDCFSIICDCEQEPEPYCGDGIINQPSEECEPPNTPVCDENCYFKNLTCIQAKDAGLLTGSISGGNAYLTNDATHDYDVGLAVYKKLDEIIDNQELFDSEKGVVDSGSTLNLSVNLPDCNYQIDLFCGDILESLDCETADPCRYGSSKIDWFHNNSQGYCTPEGFTILSHKIVCEEESDLPNWGDGGPDISSTTAEDYVDSHPGCDFEQGWDFQYAPQSASNPGDNTGEASSWTTFGPTDINGIVSTTISNISSIWLREVWKPSYINFTGVGGNDVSAEFYCHKDVANYDNYDKIIDPEENSTYYCIGFNVLEQEPLCGNNITESGEECDDGANGDDTDGCYDNCTLTYCGDSIIQDPNGYGKSEECDDGNNQDGDGCDRYCNLEPLPGNITACCCGLQVSTTPEVASQDEKVLVSADISNLFTGLAAAPSDILEVNATIYRIEDNTEYIIVEDAPMTYLDDGLWYYEFYTGRNSSGTYIASVTMLTNQTMPFIKEASDSFTLGEKVSGLTILGVSPDLININETARLAAEIKYNGIAVDSSLITNASLVIKQINGTTQTYTTSNGLQLDDGLIYVEGAFNETGVHYLDWSATYLGQQRTAREIIVLVGWQQTLDNISASNSELISLIKESRQYLLQLLTDMEYLQEFTEEEVFLITDSVNSMSKVITHLEQGDMTGQEAKKEFDQIQQELDQKLGYKITGLSVSEDLQYTPQSSSIIGTITEKAKDWRAILFIILLMILSILIVNVLVLVKLTNNMPYQRKTLQISRPVHIQEKRRYQLLLDRFRKKGTKPLRSDKRRYQIILEKIKERLKPEKEESIQEPLIKIHPDPKIPEEHEKADNISKEKKTTDKILRPSKNKKNKKNKQNIRQKKGRQIPKQKNKKKDKTENSLESEIEREFEELKNT